MFEGCTYNEIESYLKKKGISYSYGEDIKPHTVKKIDYVTKYVDEWLYVVSNVSNEIFFIDAMSNAGLYINKNLSTAISVLNIFIKHAQRHKNQNFYLLCNDYDEKKVNSMKEIFSLYAVKMRENNITNVRFEIEQNDATKYIRKLKNNELLSYKSGINRSIILYVDPYNFISNELSYAMLDFSSNVYCEIILNFFCNDYVRNVNNSKTKDKQSAIRKTLNDFCQVEKITTDAKLVLTKFIERLKNETKIKYTYSVKMKNANNVALYDLVFFTPSIKGLEKVKDATWNVFSFHDEFSYTTNDNMDPNLWGETDEDIAFELARNKVCVILNKSNKIEYSYVDLEEIILQNTFLKQGQIIDKFIKPLIRNCKLKKKGIVKSTNYKKDYYYFEGRN